MGTTIRGFSEKLWMTGPKVVCRYDENFSHLLLE